MPITVIAVVSFAEGELDALKRYLEVTAPLLEKAKAKVVKQFTLNEVVVGCRPAKQVLIVEYPDREAVDQVFNSQEYRELVPIRDRAFSTYEISIAEQVAA